MKGGICIKRSVLFLILGFNIGFIAYSKPQQNSLSESQPGDTIRENQSDLKYPFDDHSKSPLTTSENNSPLFLNNPSNVKSDVEYDPENNEYIISEKIGSMDYRRPMVMSFKEFYNYQQEMAKRNYWSEKSREAVTSQGPSLMGKIRMGETFDKVFGTDAISIVPQGSAELIFGYNISRIENPALSQRNRRNGAFTFKEKIQMNVTGSIGDKMQLGINYNTEATFDFENKTKLEYAGKEDEIIKKIEAGNITFPLTGSLISGSQSLFGLKTELQFGKLNVTTVFSHQRGQSSVIEVQGGAQVNEFEVNVEDYDANRHFFLSQFFRDNYNNWLEDLPYITSGVRIEQIEVWITNKTSDFNSDNNNIIAFMDLGEGYGPEGKINFYGRQSFIHPDGQFNVPTSNDANALYGEMTSSYSGIREFRNIATVLTPLESQYNFKGGVDYEKIESARKLSEREYTVNKELGYISLNSALRNDEVLAVAFVYTYKGKTYRVGELSTDGIGYPKTLVLKLLKGTNLTPRFTNWNLMMKNVYSLDAYQVNSQNFRLDILYRNDETGVPVNYIKEEKADTGFNNVILLRVMNLDHLDSRNEPNPDGLFDFVEGTTIFSQNGRIIFPLVEPFGSDLRKKILGNQPTNAERISIADKYTFQELYDSTQTKAKQIAEKSKFFMSGTYQSAVGSEIQLNAMNIPRNSVKVTAGGIQLTENQDYTVDYTLGRVKILNQGLLEAGTPLRISLENNALFNLQTKTLIGTHLDYKVSDNFNIGATIMNLTERPLTQKVNIGDEPISNTIWGLNTSYQTESHLLTNLIDKLPFIETKAVSSIALDAEFAHLIPGQASAINGNAYIDDFEGTETTIEMKTVPSWVLASTPREFPEGSRINDLSFNYNRAKLAWYSIDNLFTRKSSYTPDYISVDDVKNDNYAREVLETEIFTEKQSGTGFDSPLSILNLAYFPKEKGPYNYDARPSAYSSGINSEGYLQNPQTRWGGIMRDIQTSDFETSNVEYIEFWLMNPFFADTVNASPQTGGDLYFNLGEISEDVLRDSRKSYENGLPTSDTTLGIDSTIWARVPLNPSYVNSFATDPNTRQYQDVGLDGLSDEGERRHFNEYLQDVASIVGVNSPVFERLANDPSSDDFRYYLDPLYQEERAGVIECYKNYNGLENNSPSTEQSGGQYAAATTLPNTEDINRDNTLNENETYYSYRVSLRPGDLKVGSNYVIDEVQGKNVNWFLFRIPVGEYESKYGSIEDFKSIRFMRMYLTDFADSVILRFAELHLVRNEWRKYNFDISEGGPSLTNQYEDGTFEISAVNIEENSGKEPVNYVLPPGVDRVIDPSQPQVAELNEQSMVFKVHSLHDGDARIAYKNTELDLRQYKKLEMFIHAEAIPGEVLDSSDLTAFIRFGSDYKDNFYEYEIPLAVTPAGHYDPEGGRDKVWPSANKIEINLDDLVELKKNRDEATTEDPMLYGKTRIYVEEIGNNRRRKVRGTPNLSNIRTIMIGVRNPSNSETNYPNDGLPKSAEIWFNELRLTEFNNKGGWAANARVQAKLADLGTLSVAGSTIQPGFGSIEQKVDERKKEQVNQLDISSNIQLGKFFPEKSKVSIPLFVGLSRSVINPEYYPREPDRLLKDVIREADTKAERDEIKKISQDRTERTSINFTDIRVVKDFKKFKPLSPANFSLSAGYSDIMSSNYKVDYNNTIKYRAGFTYNFVIPPKGISPFRKSKLLKSPYLRLIKDFNFMPYPSRFTFRTDFDRYYNEIKLRNVYDDREIKIDSTINKDFTWNRFYDVQWDITRSLKLTFTATNVARIDEPDGAYDLFKRYDRSYWADSVWSSILQGGRNSNYNHDISISYTLPINKFPVFNWITASIRYASKFTWTRGPIYNGGNTLGNNLSNSSTTQYTSQFNLNSLYSKVGFIKRIEAKYKSGPKSGEKEKRYKTVNYSKRTFFKAGQPKNIFHKLGTENLVIKVTDANGKEIKVKTDIINENKVSITTEEDYSGATVDIAGQIERGENPIVFFAENTVRFLTGFKNFQVSYSKSGGTMFLGYMPETDIIGLNYSNSAYNGAPGIPFILGWQDANFVRDAASNGWITTDPDFSTPYNMTNTENLNIRGTFEPFRGFRIDISALRTHTKNVSEYFLYEGTTSEGGNIYNFSNRVFNGNFSISVITLSSAFEKIKSDDNYRSKFFEDFKAYRSIISGRLFFERVNSSQLGYQGLIEQGQYEGYSDGYGPTSSEVLIPAFMAAYTGTNPRNVSLNPFPGYFRMMPNWRLSFDGLARIPFFKKMFKSINITHSYQSTYNIGSFTNYVDLEYASDGLSYIRDFQNNFYPNLLINAISITEKMNPLAGIDMTWNNNLISRFEIGKSRILSLSLANDQLVETRNTDFTIGLGYRFVEVPLKINDKAYKSDLNVRFDLSVRDNLVVIRNLSEDIENEQITPPNGQRVFKIGATADYALSPRFNIQLFFDRTLNDPHTSRTFLTADTNIGFSIRFTLQ